MFCKNCGNQINDGAMFCGKCGTAVSNNNNIQHVANDKQSSKLKILIIGAVLVVACVVIIVVEMFFSGKSKEDNEGAENNSNKKVEQGDSSSDNAKELLEKMQGDWESTLTGGFFGSHYYQPHWNLYIDSDFIYVMDGVIFSHDVNEVKYEKNDGVEYIIFEDVIFHRETRSSVDVIETEEVMLIRIFFVENGNKLAFEINPDGKEWKLIAEYEKEEIKNG